MIKNWYENWFGNEYLTVYSHRDNDEAQELIQLIHSYIHLEKDSKILDLCCGQGRHALILAREGYEVYGIDLSRTLLEIAKYTKTSKQTAYFIQADMRLLPTVNSFDLLLNLFTSFGYFETDEENKSVFLQFHQVLKDGRYFVFDYFNDRFISESLVPFHRERIGNVLVEQERVIEGSRVRKKIRITKDGRQSTFFESVKMYNPDQIFNMLDNSKLSIDYVFGDYQGSLFEQNSPRLIIIGKKL